MLSHTTQTCLEGLCSPLRRYRSPETLPLDFSGERSLSDFEQWRIRKPRLRVSAFLLTSFVYDCIYINALCAFPAREKEKPALMQQSIREFFTGLPVNISFLSPFWCKEPIINKHKLQNHQLLSSILYPITNKNQLKFTFFLQSKKYRCLAIAYRSERTWSVTSAAVIKNRIDSKINTRVIWYNYRGYIVFCQLGTIRVI